MKPSTNEKTKIIIIESKPKRESSTKYVVHATQITLRKLENGKVLCEWSEQSFIVYFLLLIYLLYYDVHHFGGKMKTKFEKFPSLL